MLSSLLAVGFTLTTLTTATKSPDSLLKPQVSGPLRAGVTTHRGASGGGSYHRAKRQDVTGLRNQQGGTAYTIDIEIGTPPQNITVQLDTGSSELWVNPTCENSGDTDYCEAFSRYDYRKSSTMEDIALHKTLTYGKGNTTFEYVSDVVTIGSSTLTDQVFGVSVESYDLYMGILGLAPNLEGEDEQSYSFVLDSMVTDGIIESRAFSLDLRDIDSPDGSIVFGGVDTGKYIGALEKCPMLDMDDTPSDTDRYWINLTSIGMTLPSGESGLLGEGELPVFLDSGGTMTLLPTVLFNDIGANFPTARYDSSEDAYMVDCDMEDKDGSIDFGFNGKIISVSFKDFIWETGTENVCMLGMNPDDDEPVLGDSFLRAAYVVYDQDNRNLHLAQAANCGSNLVAISSGVNAVPSVTGDCSATAAVSVATSTLTATAAASTITDAISGLSAVAPGPQGTQGASAASGSICLSCSATATGTASPTGTSAKANAAPRETGSHMAAVGALALAAWII